MLLYSKYLFLFLFNKGSTGYNYVSNLVNSMPKRYLAYTASFSKLSTVKHVYDFICVRLKLKAEDMRLWHFHDEV